MMMLDLDDEEMSLLIQLLDEVQFKGKIARTVANLQDKMAYLVAKKQEQEAPKKARVPRLVKEEPDKA